MNFRQHICIAGTALTLLLVGCDGFGGGAEYKARVTVVSAEFGSSEPAETVADAGPATVTSADAGGFGAIMGRVVLTGTPPALALLVAKGADVKDKEVCAAEDMPDERLVLGEGNGVANTFVYLPRAPKNGKPLESSAEFMVFDQKNCRFLPHCMIVPVGQTVKILSGDPIAHNTHTYPNKNQGVNSGVAPNDREGKLTVNYRRAEATPIPVRCDFHTWMSAYHFPIDHPYAVVTDANGNFSIPEIPAGKHTFSVWHESAANGFVERRLDVTVKSGETTELEIEFPVAKLSL
jgi:plastocyanin